ncbi:MAG: zinc-binding dehydrogenase [Dehalococcoidia bacterium]
MPNSQTVVKTDLHRLAMMTLPVPEPGPDQALIRMTLSTICGSDIHLLDEFPLPPSVAVLPMGHEATGVVEAVGPGVTGFKAGDRVVTSCLSCCGYCENCQRGLQASCITYRSPGNLLFGAQGQYYLMNGAQNSMAVIPAELTDEQVLFASDIMSTGVGAVENGGVAFGDTVAVFAQGPVGLCATAAARIRGAALIIAVESVPERIAVSRQLGADLIVDPKDAVKEIMRLTGGRGVDVAIEALGIQATFENCCHVTRSGGTISSVGVYGAHPVLSFPTTDPGFWNRRVVTTLCPVGSDRLRRMMELVRHSKLDLTPLITHHLPLADALAGYDLFKSRSGGVLKIALRP